MLFSSPSDNADEDAFTGLIQVVHAFRLAPPHAFCPCLNAAQIIMHNNRSKAFSSRKSKHSRVDGTNQVHTSLAHVRSRRSYASEAHVSMRRQTSVERNASECQNLPTSRPLNDAGAGSSQRGTGSGAEGDTVSRLRPIAVGPSPDWGDEKVVPAGAAERDKQKSTSRNDVAVSAWDTIGELATKPLRRGNMGSVPEHSEEGGVWAASRSRVLQAKNDSGIIKSAMISTSSDKRASNRASVSKEVGWLDEGNSRRSGQKLARILPGSVTSGNGQRASGSWRRVSGPGIADGGLSSTRSMMEKSALSRLVGKGSKHSGHSATQAQPRPQDMIYFKEYNEVTT